MMYENYLEHHGIKGMRWGVRRYQKKDGSLTSTGKKRYNTDEEARRARRRKIAKGVAIGAGVALGAAGAAYAIRRHKERKNFDKFADYMINKNKDSKYSDWDSGAWKTFSVNRKKYSAKQYRNIVKAEKKYGDSKQFRDAVGVLPQGRAYKKTLRDTHRATRAKEQAEYIRKMASKTASKNTSRNAGDKPYMDSDELFKKRIVDHHKQQLAQRSSRPSLYDKTKRLTTSPPRSSKGPSLSLTNIEDYTEELLRRNKSRLNKAGY